VSQGPHIESLLLLSAGRTKGIRGPDAACTLPIPDLKKWTTVII